MERSNSYSRILLYYFRNRFGLLRYLLFAILLWTISLREWSLDEGWWGDILFVLATLFLFRWLDDLGSIYLDRKDHPHRLYTLPANFKPFAFLAALFLVIYIVLLFVLDVPVAIWMLGFLALTGLLYLLFYKRREIMFIIPLLKYPVILWCLMDRSPGSEGVWMMLAVFFMVLDGDLFGAAGSWLGKRAVRGVMLLLTGLLVIQPWGGDLALYWSLLLILPLPLVILLVFVPPSMRIALLYYPIIHTIHLYLAT